MSVYLMVVGDHPFGDTLVPYYIDLGISSWKLLGSPQEFSDYTGESPLWGDRFPIMLYVGEEGEQFQKALDYAERWNTVVIQGNIKIKLQSEGLKVPVVEVFFFRQAVSVEKKIPSLAMVINCITTARNLGPGLYGVEDLLCLQPPAW